MLTGTGRSGKSYPGCRHADANSWWPRCSIVPGTLRNAGGLRKFSRPRFGWLALHQTRGTRIYGRGEGVLTLKKSAGFTVANGPAGHHDSRCSAGWRSDEKTPTIRRSVVDDAISPPSRLMKYHSPLEASDRCVLDNIPFHETRPTRLRDGSATTCGRAPTVFCFALILLNRVPASR